MITRKSKGMIPGHSIEREIKSFLIDRKARGCASTTIDFYSSQLRIFQVWTTAHLIYQVEQVNREHLDALFAELRERHKPGGCHAVWRSLKAFLSWWEDEVEPEAWRNPIHKLPAPKISTEPLPGLTRADLDKMLAVLDKSSYGLRCRAILTVLYDTGMRVSELTALTYNDADLDTGTLLVRKGKGGKRRPVFIGDSTRRDLLRYLRRRPDIDLADPLFAKDNGKPYSRKGIETMVGTLGERAGVTVPHDELRLDRLPSPHDFRRGFTKTSLKNGANIIDVARQLGHSTDRLVWRYDHTDDDDLRETHERTSPVDRKV